jgi:hypothetical protein
MLLRYQIPVEAGNEAVRSGTTAELTESMITRLNPEAAYFGTDGGKRTGYLFFDLSDVSEMPGIAEPLFQTFNASVDVFPVMNIDDLRRGVSGIEKI